MARAQYNLALKYRNGLGVPQDYKEAVKWYWKNKMGYEELVKKNNTIHPTAVINWEKVQMGNGNVVGPFVCRGTDAQRKNQMATYILETIIPLENLRQYICQQKFQRLLLSAMKIILCVIRILPMTVRLKVK